MKLIRYLPNFKLASIVKQYYILSLPHNGCQSFMGNHPQGCFDFVFLLDGSMIYKTSRTLQVITQPYIYMGQLDRHFEISLTSGATIAGISLYPQSFYFFNHLLDKTESAIQAKDSEYPIYFYETLNKLRDAQDPQTRFQLLEQFIYSRLCESLTSDKTTTKLIKEITQRNGMVNIEEIAFNAGISTRTMQRKFINHMGITPKTYAKTIRFHSILNYVEQPKEIDWSAVATMFNYSDQSHMIKDFKRFTGHSPGQFLCSNRKLAEFFRQSLHHKAT